MSRGTSVPRSQQRVPELPRDPLHLLLALVDRRHALRRPRSSAAAPIRTRSACSATSASTSLDAHLARTDGHERCATRSESRRIVVLRRLPAEAAARRTTRPAPVRDLNVVAAAQPAVHRVHGGLQHLLLPGVLRAGNRHHAHAPGRHARLERVHPRRRRGRPVARPHRLLQLRRSVPAQARRRDVRVHQDDVPAHLSLHEHERAGAERGEGASPGALRHRRGDVLDRRRVAGHLRALSAARQVRRSRSPTCAPWPTRRRRAAATCRSSTGATSCSRGTTTTRR